MSTLRFRMAAASFALGALALSAAVSTEVQAQTPAVDPAAVQILKRMTDYLASLKQFSVHTENTLEAKQEAAVAPQPTFAAPPAPPPAAAGTPLPVGTVVATLPAGCASTPVGGVEYYYCGGNFYRAMFQANTLVYVTAQPK